MTCRNVELAEWLASMNGAELPSLPRCEELVRYRTRLAFDLLDSSVSILGRFELCHHHDALVRSDRHYGGSWTVRQPAKT